MRPLELKLSGFRSYRTERTIPLADLGLFAIIGDTGAGKSSLLEAITWALYGASTWSEKAHTELLAHGAKRMSVGLTFEASGQTWKLTRTYARSGAGGAELVCESDATIAKIDGVRGVNARVPEIVGLSYEVFCSCVLLPQGKFERLLKARPGTRTDLLKTILRLDQLADVREIADQQERLLGERLLEIAEARGRFRPDPAGDLARTRDVIASLTPERDRLQAARETVERLDAEFERARAAGAAALTAAERLAARRGDWPAELSAIVTRAAELAPQIALIATQREAADEQLYSLDEQLAKASDAGTDAASLAQHSERVVELRRRLGERASLRDALGQQRHRAEAAAIATQGHRAEADAARAALELLEHDLTEAATTLQESEAAHRAFTEARGQLDVAQGAVNELAVELQQARDAWTSARGAHATAAAHAEEAQRNRDADATRREDAMRRNAAAHVAAGCAPGDPCPVCARTLPGDFAAPVADDLDEAGRRLEQTEQVLAAAAQASLTADSDERVAERQVGSVDKRHTAAVAERDRAQARLEELCRSSDSPSPVLAEAVHAELEARLTAARTRHDSLRAARTEREATRTQTASALAAAEADERAATRSLQEAQAALDRTGSEIAARTAELPAFCALPAPEELTDATLAGVAEIIAAKRAEAEGLLATAAAARVEADRLRGAAHQLQLAVEREVTGPATRARDAMLGLAEELPVSERARLPEAATVRDLAALLRYAEALDLAVDVQILAFRTAASNAEASLVRATDAAVAALAHAGRPDRATLKADLESVRVDIRSAEREARIAERELPGATRLDELAASAHHLRASFAALRDALNDGAFVGFVVARRQRALLAYASRVLEEITGRYAFTDDFQILDRESGLPRSPDTLSGGETFIASLALALGLVEVADRSGGDLRALFLDEGFGTLDATVLDTALTALQERAKGGRLIGLISHVPTVAERIDTVLEVRDTVEGSTVVLLTGEERDRRVMDHVGAAAGLG